MSALCPPEVSRLVGGMLDADPDPILDAATQLAGAGLRSRVEIARFAGTQIRQIRQTADVSPIRRP